MKTSLSVWSLHKYMQDRSMDNERFIDFAATTGVSGVELLSVFWNKDGKEMERIERALERNGLEIACFGACNNLVKSDPESRKEQIRDITDSVDKAVLFGTRVVRVFSGDKKMEIATYEQAKAWIIEGLKEAADYAKRKGVTLCLENHGYFAGKSDQVLDIIQNVGSESLKSTFDTGNFLLVDEDPSDAVMNLSERIAHVHLKDFQRVDEAYQGYTLKSIQGIPYAGKAPGEGMVDLGFILGQLKQLAYDGWLTVEFEGEEEQKAGSARSIKNLQQILSTI